MAVKDCIDRINKAAGRVLTDAEVVSVVARVHKEVARLARKEGFDSRGGGLPDFKALPPGLIREAAISAAKGLLHDAQKKRQNVALAIIAHDRIKAEIDTHKTVAKGLGRVMEMVDEHAKAIEATYLARMRETMEATNPRFFGLIEDAKGVRDLLLEMFGEDSGNPVAKKAGKIWRDTAEAIRQRWNRAGGDIGLLADWGMTQSHDMRLVLKAGQQAWTDFVMTRINRSRYKTDTGRQMTDLEIRNGPLAASFKTISTDGVMNIVPGDPRGSAMLAKKHAEHRVIHFETADGWLEYANKFSGRSIYNTMTHHVSTMARDIALIEDMGPNSGHQFQYWHDMAAIEGTAGRKLDYLRAFYAQLDGSANYVVDYKVARFYQALRNYTVAVKLLGAPLSAVTDFATGARTARFNRLPALRYASNMIKSFNPLDKRDQRRANNVGLGLGAMISEANRYSEGAMGAGFSSLLASASMRATGIVAFTEAGRRGFQISMVATLGDLTAKPWADLHPGDKAQLKHYGITPADWKILQKAVGEDWGGENTRVLTIDSIRLLTDADLGSTGAAAERARDTLSTKVLAMTLAEGDFAVVTPGAKERAIMHSIISGRGKGTRSGELAAVLWMFKSFPIAMISKHWMRGWGMKTTGGKAAYIGSVVIGTTILGAVALQLKDLSKGKELRDMTTWEFWVAAFLQGGGLGIFGDFLFSDESRFGRSFVETAVGPVWGGMLPDLKDLTLGNIHQAARGEATHFGAEALKFGMNNTPLINIWYGRALLDRVMFQQMQEHLSPGYLEKVRQRSIKATGQDIWNRPR